MDSRQKKIDDLLGSEMAGKSFASTTVFVFLSIVMFFYYFDLESSKWAIRAACLIIFVFNIGRYYACYRMEKTKDYRTGYWLVYAGVWMNSIGWCVIFVIATLSTKASGVHFAVMALLQTGFVSGSLINLAYDKKLFFPFQVCILIIPALATYYVYEQTDDSAYLVLVSVYVAFFLYQMKQYFEFKTFHTARLQHQVDLELSHEALEKSQKAIVDQTINMIQASKATALGEMAGGLSHEVNNSLMVILGSVQQLERSLRQDYGPNPTYELKIERARGAIQRIKTVVDSLRYFSQQMGPVPKEDTSLKNIMERTLNFSYEMIKANSIRLEVAEIPDITISCQPSQITQILFNIIKNAFDAIERVSSSEEKWIKIAFEKRSREIIIRISNGGPKISADSIPKLFNPFFTTKEVGKGTGLSLSISMGIAKDHQGDLALDEKEPSTTFMLRLPC